LAGDSASERCFLHQVMSVRPTARVPSLDVAVKRPGGLRRLRGYAVAAL
jgi:hypothetical protein